jgi:amino acid transporter
VAEAHLGRVVTLWPAVGLAITLVVGSGVLVLPGLAYAAHGAAAVWSWVIAAAVCSPLLVVIAALGARYPTAGGIAGFVRPALGDGTADIAELLLLGAIPGGAALALVAGQLVADLVAVPWLVGPVAAGKLLVAGAAAHRGAEFAGVLVRGLAATFVAMLLIVAIAGLASGHYGLGPGGVSGIRQGLESVCGWRSRPPTWQCRRISSAGLSDHAVAVPRRRRPGRRDVRGSGGPGPRWDPPMTRRAA